MKIIISKAARHALRRSHKRELIARKIEELSRDPATLAGNAVRLQGRPGSRLRVQDWRVIFRTEGETLHID